MKIFSSIVLSLCFIIAGNVFAEEGEKLESDIMVLPVMMYTTDTGFGAGAAGLYSYNPERERTSNAQAFFVYTEKHQTEAALNLDHFFIDNRSRIQVKGNYRKFPTSLFRMGNLADNDDPATYTPEMFSLELMFERRLLEAFRIKPKIMFRNQTLQKYKAGDNGLFIPMPWLSGRMDMVLGLSFNRDTRDNLFATETGSFVQMTVDGSVYQDYGSSFNSIQLDARYFFMPVGKLVSASMFFMKDSRGDVPFYFMADIGGNDRLRGYEYDRFKDRSAILLQQDFRFPVWRFVGAAVFASTGRVAPHADELFEGKWHSAAGAGLRFFFNQKEHQAIRLDYAKASDAVGVYVTFSEAF